MVLRIGTDIENIKRFKKACKNRKFLDLIFTDKEIKYCQQKKKPYVHFAEKFCIKEAVIKAYSKKILIKNIEIINLKSIKPKVSVNSKIDKKIRCTTLHTENYVVAFVAIDK